MRKVELSGWLQLLPDPLLDTEHGPQHDGEDEAGQGEAGAEPARARVDRGPGTSLEDRDNPSHGSGEVSRGPSFPGQASQAE